jgi:hypothetical protein
MHLVGYLYEDYHDARSLERKINEHKAIISFARGLFRLKLSKMGLDVMYDECGCFLAFTSY